MCIQRGGGEGEDRVEEDKQERDTFRGTRRKQASSVLTSSDITEKILDATCEEKKEFLDLGA